MRKTERLHAIVRQLAIRKNCYSINHHSLFKVRNAECLNHRLWLIVTAGLVRQLFWDTQQTFVCCWCYYITYVCMCQHLFLNFLKLFSGRFYPDTYACTSTIEKSLLLYLKLLDASISLSYTRYKSEYCTILHKTFYISCTSRTISYFFISPFIRRNISKIQK